MKHGAWHTVGSGESASACGTSVGSRVYKVEAGGALPGEWPEWLHLLVPSLASLPWEVMDCSKRVLCGLRAESAYLTQGD